MWRALEEREKTRQEYIEVAARYVDALAEVLSPLTGILYGSVARGDFNFWTCSPANCCRTALFFATIFTFGAGNLGTEYAARAVSSSKLSSNKRCRAPGKEWKTASVCAAGAFCGFPAGASQSRRKQKLWLAGELA